MEISGQRQKGHTCMEQRNDGTEVMRVKIPRSDGTRQDTPKVLHWTQPDDHEPKRIFNPRSHGLSTD